MIEIIGMNVWPRLTNQNVVEFKDQPIEIALERSTHGDDGVKLLNAEKKGMMMNLMIRRLKVKTTK